MNNKQVQPNMIAAYCIVSESDINYAVHDYHSNWEFKQQDKLKNILHNFGMDINRVIEVQRNLRHVNRQNQVVQCNRFVGFERLDEEWLSSGNASREAQDKASGNKMVEDRYRMRGLTEDVQAVMESKDKYREETEESEN